MEIDWNKFWDGESVAMAVFIIIHAICMEWFRAFTSLSPVSEYVIGASLFLFVFSRIWPSKWLNGWAIVGLNSVMILGYLGHWLWGWFPVIAG